MKSCFKSHTYRFNEFDNQTLKTSLEYVDKFKRSSYISVMKFTVEKLPQAKVEIEYVYVKDSEGYVFKKGETEVTPDEKIISEKDYMKTSGLAAYEKEFGHGGARENAGRKQKFSSPLKFQIRVTQEEKDFITYARKHHINYTAMMK